MAFANAGRAVIAAAFPATANQPLVISPFAAPYRPASKRRLRLGLADNRRRECSAGLSTAFGSVSVDGKKLLHGRMWHHAAGHAATPNRLASCLNSSSHHLCASPGNRPGRPQPQYRP
jgi:hypothetical protein